MNSVVKFHPGVADCHARLAEAHDNLGHDQALGRLLKPALAAHEQAEAEIAEALRLAPGNARFRSLALNIKKNHEVTSKRIRSSTCAAAGNERAARP